MMNNTIQEIRKDFPALQMQVYGKPMVFLDGAASSLKPRCVAEALSDYYLSFNSNVHRGSYKLSQMASNAFDKVRVQVKDYINASSEKEIIFTKGTTEAINLLAHGLADELEEGDNILLSQMEHHANIIPWQNLCEKKKASLKVIPLNEDGSLKIESMKQLLSERTKVLAITQISNVLGTINPLKDIIEVAHRYGVIVVVDGAQGIVHSEVDVKDLDCDFYCFSGHKFYAPMGIGVLYGKADLLDKMPPYQLGGAMIDKVSFEKTSFKKAPLKFEAGTPNVGGVIGLGKAIDYVEGIGWETINSIESNLLLMAEDKLRKIKGLNIIGQASNKASISSITVDGLHPYDVGTLLDKFGVACRAGNHCTQPLHDFLGIVGTVRASFAFYNTEEEIDLYVNALSKTIDMLR